MKRIPIALLPYALAAAVIVGGYLWHLSDGGRTQTFGEADVGGPFTLTDQTGAARSDTDFRGRFMLIYFGYSNCPDVCPIELGVMADALARLGPMSHRVAPIFITVDPARDTRDVLKIYMDAFGPDFIGLTGSEAAVKQAADAYHVYFSRQPLKGGGYAMDHSSVIYLIGPTGRFVTFYGEGTSPDDIATDLRKRF